MVTFVFGIGDHSATRSSLEYPCLDEKSSCIMEKERFITVVAWLNSTGPFSLGSNTHYCHCILQGSSWQCLRRTSPVNRRKDLWGVFHIRRRIVKCTFIFPIIQKQMMTRKFKGQRFEPWPTTDWPRALTFVLTSTDISSPPGLANAIRGFCFTRHPCPNALPLLRQIAILVER